MAVEKFEIGKSYRLINREDWLAVEQNKDMYDKYFSGGVVYLDHLRFQLNVISGRVHIKGLDGYTLFINDNINDLESFELVTENVNDSVEDDTDIKQQDLFNEVLSLARKHKIMIQFDGVDDEDAIVVTHCHMDIEYVIKDIEDFNKLVGSLETLQSMVRE